MEPGTRVRVVNYSIKPSTLIGLEGTVIRTPRGYPLPYIRVVLDNPPEQYAYFLFFEYELEVIK